MWNWIKRRRESRRQRKLVGKLASRATKSVGYWRSSDEESRHLPCAQDYVDPDWDPGIRAQVIRHLLEGEAFLWCLGYSDCRFCGCNNGLADLTDGVYVWPEGFAHYLQEHDVRPPDEFVEHVLAVANRPLAKWAKSVGVLRWGTRLLNQAESDQHGAN